MRTTKYLFALLSCLFLSTVAQASPLMRDQVPEPLKPWIDWVLQDHEKDFCPFLQGIESQKPCAWPSPLTLSLTEKAGNFSQNWRLYADEWVPLPGDEKHWPLDVTSDGRPASVILREDKPGIYLQKGDHSVQGSFSWDSLPESFTVPAVTGALKLSVKGIDVPRPNLTEDGLLWLQSKTQASQAEDSLDVRIHRQMEDDIPFVMTTAIDLDVAGKTREIVFAPLLPEKFVPIAIDSPLPAHLEDDGRLKIQVRSGHWQIRLKARHEGPVSAITLPKLPETPAGEVASNEALAQEVWAFAPHNDLRLATIEGVTPVDPQQTTLPDEWKRLAAYRVQRGDTIRFVEQRRGDADGSPDQLTLTRRIWLDFDGDGYTVQDQIGGNFHRNTRLEMTSPVALGRVAVNGMDQLITRVPGNESAGIEIRQGPANLSADSRIDKSGGRGRSCSMPAIGWNHDFQSVSGTLELPPGWRAFGVWGADHVPNTWLNRWTLLDIFLVLVLALSFAKIWNPKWGVIALIALTLTFPENGAPMWTWLAVLAGEALVRLLPPGFKGKIRIPLKLYRAASLIVLLVVTIPFAVVSLRHALYPSLEEPFGPVLSAYDSDRSAMPLPAAAPMGGANDEAMPPPPPQAAGEMQQMEEPRAERPRMMKMAIKKEAAPLSASFSKRAVSQQLFQQIPGAQVQTGPGLPRWNWTSIPLQWSGPVMKDQVLRLFLLGPCSNLCLAVLRLILLAALILRLLNFPGKFWPAFMRKHLIAGLLIGLALAASPRAARADYPTQDLLNQLRDRLVQKPDCAPNCASISRMKVEATPTALRMRLEISAQAHTAVPLPANPKEWMPELISVDGARFAGVRRSDDGQAWIELTPGAHQVVIEGRLGADRQSIQIPLPLKPYHVEASLQGWSVEGLHEDGLADDNLQLARTQPLSGGSPSKTDQIVNNLPPFARVERRLVLGLTWNVETQIVRLTPTGTSIVLEVPLLPGESVTSEGIRVQGGKVLVSMAPQVSEFSWSSVLQQTGSVALKSAAQGDWAELWTLEPASIWHVDPEGIPMIPPQDAEASISQWKPWPGEQVVLKISRPEGVPGPTITIDHSLFSVSPGVRYTEATLSLEMRSSLGGQHVVTLPAGAELQSVLVNGQSQPIRQVDQKITLPLAPGSQNFEIKWQQPAGIGLFFRSPKVDLGVPSVNTDLQFQYPERWVLLVGGPRLGPAVLFWSLLIVMILVAVGLSRSGLTPLSTFHWVLLSFGLTQTPIWASVIFVGWFLALGWRQKNPRTGPWTFDLIQITLVIWTATAVGILFGSIYQGLLGSPDMQILGNGSTSILLKWFQDRSSNTLPRPWAVSLPMFCYRIAMLSWALWVAWAFITWLKWAWKGFTKGGTWKPVRLVKKSG